MPDTPTNRRRFDRIATDKPIVVQDADGQHTGIVLDISLRGLLFTVADDWRPARGRQLQARIDLGAEMCCIDLEGEVAHVEDDHIGLHCLKLDVDSAGRLRRLVELNLADHDLLERNLGQLIGSP